MAISGALPVEFWDQGCLTYNEIGSTTARSENGTRSIPNYSPGTFHRCFCQPFNNSDEITFEWIGAFGVSLRVIDEDNDVLATYPFNNVASNVYTVTFIPYDHSICNQKIQFQIIKTSNGALLYKSDCVDLKENHKESILIKYYNSVRRNFAGLNYADTTPDPIFWLRVPASFFHQRFPEEQEVIELSNSRLIQLNAEVKSQRLLEIGPVPYYMHQKLLLVLKHDFVSINGVYYVKQESYDIVDSSRRNPLRQAKVWLTQKDYVVRNIL